MTETDETTLIVVESLFGNTRAVADAIADGLRERSPHQQVRVVAAADPLPPLQGASLLLLDGPTHAFAMTRNSTREDAVKYGATENPRRGLGDWIKDAAGSAEDFPGLVVTFDTRIRRIPGSAAASAAKALRRAGFARVERGESFWVTGTSGPLADGELDRSHSWGRTMGSRLADTTGRRS